MIKHKLLKNIKIYIIYKYNMKCPSCRKNICNKNTRRHMLKECIDNKIKMKTIVNYRNQKKIKT